MKARIFLTLTAVALLLPAMSQPLPPAHKLAMTEQLIEAFYVGDIDTTAVVEDAIRGMLKRLDPHSSYSTAEETKALNEPLQGNFSGVGIQFQLLDDTLHVVQVVPGGPSEKVGILPGDRILAAGDSLLSGVKRQNSDVQRLLRGPKGTTVDIRVRRPGLADEMAFAVTRDDIPVHSVDAAFMIAPQTGYVRVSRFGEKTAREVTEACYKLAMEGMQHLILDLQDNGGGYLGAAIQTASLFLEPGAPVVSTRGDRVEPQSYVSDGVGVFAKLPVTVLVNQYSASAAEILAGALQDNDRALVVGRRTFGKGLVQRPFPFPDGSMIRLTTARYYLPSGRCVQKPYREGEADSYRHELIDRYDAGEYFSVDSLHLPADDTYRTLRLGRVAYGGGGVIPDVFVPVDTTYNTAYYRTLSSRGLLQKVSAQYLDTHRAALHAAYPDMETFLATFDTPDELIEALVAAGTAQDIARDDEALQRSLPMLRAILKGLVGRDLFDQSAYFAATLPLLDPVVLKALDIVENTPSATEQYMRPGSLIDGR